MQKQNIIKTYLERLQGAELHTVTVNHVLAQGGGNVSLNCFTINYGSTVRGFTKSKGVNVTQSRYQYDLRNYGHGRPKAVRVIFLESPSFGNQEYTVSHLCHTDWCINPRHLVLETLPDNKGRNGCPGPGFCQHSIQCLMPGPNYNGSSSESPTLNHGNEIALNTFLL